MPSYRVTRRHVLRSLGTAATAVAAGTSGCVIGLLPTSTRSADPPSKPPERSQTPRSPATEPSPTPPAAGHRPYRSFSAVPDAFGFESSYRFTSIRPATVATNQETLGLAYNTLVQRWLWLDHLVPFADQHLVASLRYMTAVAGDYERDNVVRYYKDKGLEYLTSHRGVELYGGMLSGYTQQVVGVGDAVIYIQGSAGIARGRRRIEHLIDVLHGVTTPYVEQSQRYDAVTAHLPQGAYTRVHPQVPLEESWISEYDVVAAGETLLLDTDRRPAEGRTVLQYDPSVPDPLAGTERILTEHDRLIQFPMTDPTLRQPAPRTVVLSDSVDPATLFETRV